MLNSNQSRTTARRGTSWRRHDLAGTLWLALLGLLVALGLARAAEAVASKEYQIKAAFVYNFAKFVDWPASAFPKSDSPIVFAVLGSDAFALELEKALKDRKINGRDLVAKRISNLEGAAGAHVLFVSSSQDGHLAELQAILKGHSVLTVGESPAFAAAGGMINFVMEGDKVRFEINIDEVEAAGLKISAQLQKLAKAIRKKS